MYDTLNDNGRMVCRMAATLSSGIMANPAYNGSPINAEEMVNMAAEMCRYAMNHEELRLKSKSK